MIQKKIEMRYKNNKNLENNKSVRFYFDNKEYFGLEILEVSLEILKLFSSETILEVISIFLLFDSGIIINNY